MATSLTTTFNQQMQGFTSLPRQSQVGLLVGVAAVVALVASLFLWVTRPSYAVLFPGLGERESAQVMEALGRQGINYRIDPMTGALTVPAGRVHEARLQMATEGLPRTGGFGFELMEQDQGIGTSRLVETARYHRALEGELARSVSTLASVETARVHLAMPRETVFVRDRTKPSASVLVNLHPGRTLTERQVAGIVHLVSSSIPDLEPERVTVVDQRGQLLTPRDEDEGMNLSTRNLEFTRRMEESYVRRIMDIVSPIVGPDGVRAQVSADLDFSRIERTIENYDPELTALRSEQLAEEESRGSLGMMGIPGALTNQPPAGGVLDAEGEGVLGPDAAAMPGSSSRRMTRNYEVDRTISHVREAPGTVRRLSVAVVLDFREQLNEDGEMVREPIPQEELQRIENLVREAVGFDARRGDSVNVMNAPFRAVAEPDPFPAPVIWQEPWAQDLARMALVALVALLLILLVVRPMLKGLAAKGAPETEEEAEERKRLEGEGLGEDQLSLTHEGAGEPQALPGKKPASYEENLQRVRELIKEDPKLVAQVVKNWVAEDGS
ncbi:flagellar basal-body MS-ring/collar protein FliF [Ectothiorhodospira shaposhnikovii]|uniref:flagellar basal-body MS-ring/collar protein FliF n=1 Tax=Ectothiorhodospira shaposhnikovii TaxID=1054 RepID=UPI001EE8BEF5|nr:flagellar basal-body MS-ring/collar protein FliF [Ectothiorhodospira shaposhnikovii]MCG5514211.1 flagellar M-ring protein FliF [Ectothiorhodospira shaposhnikovii]